MSDEPATDVTQVPAPASNASSASAETFATPSAAGEADSSPSNPTEQTLLPASGSSAGSETDVTRVGSATPGRLSPVIPGLPDVPGYQVTREVARGGMGVVYAAHDPAFEREVAIKVMHHGQEAERFVIESKVTAQLPHPGVPPVYALGTLPDCRPFLAMKLIQGHTLAAVLKSSGPADLPGLLSTFEHICQTVGFAHARGIIHRDLKPANVMVGRFGEVLVMDWGLAKVGNRGQETGDRKDTEPLAASRRRALDDETQAGQVKGTPAFMAPEQARGEPVDARADVFALGGLLKALLTGKAPFGGTTVLDTIKSAAAGELTETFARLDACGADADLIAIAKTCLAPKAEDRYANGEEVARAVSAYRAGVEERLRRAERERAVNEAEAREQRKRRKVQFALAASVALLLAAAGGFAWWRDKQAMERQMADERAATERARIETERKMADERAEVERVRLEGDRKAANARADAERNNKEQQARQGVAANLRIADILREHYRFPTATAVLAQAAELAKGAPDLLPKVQQAQRDLAFVVQLNEIRHSKLVLSTGAGKKSAFNTKKLPPAYRKAFAARDLDLAVLDPVTAAKRIATSAVAVELVAAIDDWVLHEPDTALQKRLLAVAKLAEPGDWSDHFRDPAARANAFDIAALAVTAADENPRPTAINALAELMQMSGMDPTDLLSKARTRYPTDFELAFTLGQWYMQKRRHADAVGAFEAARAIWPDNPAVNNNLGAAFLALDRSKAALAAFERAIELDRNYAEAHNNRGAALHALGKTDAAFAAFERAIEIDPNHAAAHSNRGRLLADRGESEKAVKAYRAALEFDPDHFNAHLGLGNALSDLRDYRGAIKAYRGALEVDSNNAITHNNLGNALANSGDPQGAVKEYEKAIDIDDKYAEPWHGLGRVLSDNGNKKDAELAYKKALEIDPKHVSTLINYGNLLRRTDVNASIAMLKKATEVAPKDAVAHYNLGLALSAKDDDKAAAEAYRAAIKLNPDFFEAHTNLSGTLNDLGDPDGAIKSAREAIRIRPKDSRPYNNIGIALITKRDFDGAIKAFETAVTLDPNNKNAKENLEQAKKDKALHEKPLAPPPREKK